ncbi:MAG TPA: hypothetical protein VH482_14180 [Thermomicrobiales bacterium]|jgi:hypothetical protein
MFGSGCSSVGVSRRSVLFGGGAALAAGVLAKSGIGGALAQDATPAPAEGTPEAGKQTLKEKLEQYGYLWSSASPATHKGDVYTLTVTNPGTSPVKLWVFTILADRRQRHVEVLIKEEFELAGGQSRDLTATNDYGTANLFSTRIVTDAADTSALTLNVTIADATGQQTATFDERAFRIESYADLKQLRQDRRAARKARRQARRKAAGLGGANNGAEGTPDATETPMA